MSNESKRSVAAKRGEGQGESSSSSSSTTHTWNEWIRASVECELCNEAYDLEARVPRLLGCGHTFCQSCLEDWAGRSSVTLEAGSTDIPPCLIECPTCRCQTRTEFHSDGSFKNLPKNYEVLRIREELKIQARIGLEELQKVWHAQTLEKERMANEARERAHIAQREAEKARAKSLALMEQVEINEKERLQAENYAIQAQRNAEEASSLAQLLQEETISLKEKARNDAQQLAQMEFTASTHAAKASQLQSRADSLQKEVEHAHLELSLHARKSYEDPSQIVVIVCDPVTENAPSFALSFSYTRYTVCTFTNLEGADAVKRTRAWKTSRHKHDSILPVAAAVVKVYRRYNDFVWLYNRLAQANPAHLVPSLPEKQIFNNLQVDLVEERMYTLQAFLRGILWHPVLSKSENVKHFLLATTEEMQCLIAASQDLVDDTNTKQNEAKGNESKEEKIKEKGSKQQEKAKDVSVQSHAWSTTWKAVSSSVSSGANWLYNQTPRMALPDAAAAGAAHDFNQDQTNKISWVGTTLDVKSSMTSFPFHLLYELDIVRSPREVSIVEQTCQRWALLHQLYERVLLAGQKVRRKQRKHFNKIQRFTDDWIKAVALDEPDMPSSSTPKIKNRSSRSEADLLYETRLQSNETTKDVDDEASITFWLRYSRECFDALVYSLDGTLDEMIRFEFLQLHAIQDAFARLHHLLYNLHQEASSTTKTETSSDAITSTTKTSTKTSTTTSSSSMKNLYDFKLFHAHSTLPDTSAAAAERELHEEMLKQKQQQKQREQQLKDQERQRSHIQSMFRVLTQEELVRFEKNRRGQLLHWLQQSAETERLLASRRGLALQEMWELVKHSS